MPTYTPEQVKNLTEQGWKAGDFDSSLPDRVNGKSQRANVPDAIGSNQSPTASISSEKGASTITNAVTEHQNDMNLIAPKATVQTDKPEKPTNKKNPAMEGMGAITPEEATATGVNTEDYTYDTNSGYLIPKSGTQKANDVNTQFDADKKEIEDTFGSFMASADASTQNLIRSYQNLAAESIAEEKKVIENEKHSAETTNLRTGVSRYAPGQAASTLSDVERQGLDRIRKIGVEETSLIAKAQESLTDKKFDIFMKQRDELKDIRKERVKKIEELQKEAVKKLEEQKKQKIQASRDATIADLVTQGVTDSSEMMGILNGDGQGDFTADEISKALKVFHPDDALKNLTPDYRTYNYLKKIGDPSVKDLSYFQFEAAVSNAKRKPDEVGSDLLSVSDAKALGLPYGTTKGEATKKGITPNDKNEEYSKAQKFVEDNPDASPQEIEQGIRANTKGLTEADIKSLTGDQTKLTRESVAKLFDITDDENKSSFLGIEWGETHKEKLTNIMEAIEKYRGVGYSDKEILKLLNE